MPSWSQLIFPCSMALCVFSIAGSLGLGIRLLFAAVARNHPQVLLYLAAQMARDRAWYRNPGQIAPMGWAEVATVLAAAWVLYGLCREALAEYPAIRRFAGQSLVVTLSVCVMLGLAILWFNPATPTARSQDLQQFNATIQAVDGGVLAFLLAFGAVLVWFPLKMRRNTVYIIIGFAIFFLTHCLDLLIQNIAPSLEAWTNLVEFGVACLLLICGLVLLNKEGQSAPVTTGGFNSDDMGKLTRQLDAINDKLSKMSDVQPGKLKQLTKRG